MDMKDSQVLDMQIPDVMTSPSDWEQELCDL